MAKLDSLFEPQFSLLCNEDNSYFAWWLRGLNEIMVLKAPRLVSCLAISVPFPFPSLPYTCAPTLNLYSSASNKDNSVLPEALLLPR